MYQNLLAMPALPVLGKDVDRCTCIMYNANIQFLNSVPGLRNGWRGWYRAGQSGYMIYNKWMYFVTLSGCPCEYNKPGAPQPAKPRDCVRLGECQSVD